MGLPDPAFNAEVLGGQAPRYSAVHRSQLAAASQTETTLTDRYSNSLAVSESCFKLVIVNAQAYLSTVQQQ